MIRREIQLSENERLWLLVSQVDHARISGTLTQNLKEQCPQEVVEAITHHDDGWAEWEASPRINSEIGGPFSFLEMPLVESLPIWDNSIVAARKFGPLAGFIVAGHFYGLLGESDHAQEPAATAWLTAKRKVRTAWLDEWIRSNPANSLELAQQAQRQLAIADLFSLWLCCDTPLSAMSGGMLENSAMGLRLEKLWERYRISVIGAGRRHATPENTTEALAWVVAVDPFPFGTAPLSLSTTGKVVPVAEYDDWQDVEAASRPMELRWRLVPPDASGKLIDEAPTAG